MDRKGKIKQLYEFKLYDPRDVLGSRKIRNKLTFSFFLPNAREVYVEIEGERQNIIEISSGLYELELPVNSDPKKLLTVFKNQSGIDERRHSPYAFEPIYPSEIYNYQKGDLFHTYRFMGASIIQLDNVDGVNFLVYSPSAKSVSVIGNFNNWNHTANPMIPIGDSGVWGLFIPEVKAGEIYKYAIRGKNDEILEKGDPYAYETELRPRTGSIVAYRKFQWNDKSWIRRRTMESDLKKPISVYEVHLGSWMRKGEGMYESYLSLENKLIPYLIEKNFTHVEFMPLLEHPLDDSWGYQVSNYFSPTSRFGNPDALKHLIDSLHQNDIGVIMDWVPGHFPKDPHSLGLFDGTHLYEYEDPRKGEHRDWGTYIFDYGRPHVRNFLISNVSYWIQEFHCDGIRIDAVSSMLYLDYSRDEGEWIPNIYGGRENLEAISFLKDLNDYVHKISPGVMMIAEESTAWDGITRETSRGGLGFDMKWNMGWMHDTLEYFSKDSIHRRYHHNELIFTFWYCFSEKYILPLSHDEVVHGKGSIYGKMPGDNWQKNANIRLLYSYMFAFPGKKLLFMGNEFGVHNEWNFAGDLMNNLNPDTYMNGISRLIEDLNKFYTGNKFLGSGDFNSSAFQWIDNKDSENSVISFIRRSEISNEILVFVFNFTPVVRDKYRIGVPAEGWWEEIFNSDSQYYGGSGVGNLGRVESEKKSSHGFKSSVSLTLPPLAGFYLKWKGD